MQFKHLTFITNLFRVTDEESLSEIAQYDPSSVFFSLLSKEQFKHLTCIANLFMGTDEDSLSEIAKYGPSSVFFLLLSKELTFLFSLNRYGIEQERN